MQTPDIPALLQRLKLQTVDGVHQAELDGRHYRLPQRLHEAASVLKLQGLESGLETLAQRWDVAAAEREQLRADLCQSLAALAQGEAKHGYIHSGVTVLKAGVVQRAAECLLPLFQRWVVLAVLLATLLVLLDLFVFKTVGGSELRRLDLSAMDWLIAYACIGIVLLFHELGHATGLRAVGQAPQQIGFGFFLVFPVFYANVSNAWLVSRRSRFVVNLGGIYFQMIAAILLYIGVAFTEGHLQACLGLAFKSNLATACFVLIPFIRNDGYWMLADWLGSHDLYQRAGGMSWIIFRRLLERRPVTRQEWCIGLYALCNYSFLAVVIWALCKSLFLGLGKVSEVLQLQGFSALATEYPGLLFSTGISLMFFVLFARPFIRRAYQHVKPKSRSL